VSQNFFAPVMCFILTSYKNQLSNSGDGETDNSSKKKQHQTIIRQKRKAG
jgi:hypothetical protein